MIVRYLFLNVALAALFIIGCQKAKPPSSEGSSKEIPPSVAEASPTAEASVAAATANSGMIVQFPNPVAIVNGEKISSEFLLKDLNEAAAANGMKLSDLSKEQQLGAARLVLDQIITEKLVEKACAGQQVSDAEVKAELQKLEQQFPSQEEFNRELQKSGQTLVELQSRIKEMLRRRMWAEGQTAGKDKATEAEAQKFYEENIEEFKHGEEVGAQHILFLLPKDANEQTVAAKKQEAEKALARAKKGEDFSALARELSEEPGAKQTAGDLGYFASDRMVKEFSDQAFALKPGEISAPVRTQFGWHIIKSTGRKPAGTTPFDEVKVQLVAMLTNSNQRAAMQEALKKLKDKADVQIFLPAPNAVPSSPEQTPGITMPEPSATHEPSATTPGTIVPESSATPTP